MAFQMSRSESRLSEEFSSEDEAILRLASESEDFPQLSIIWRDFYKDIRVYPEISKVIARELRAIMNSLEAVPLAKRCDALANYFESASESNELIYCTGD